MKEDDPAVVERCLVSVRPFIRAWRIADSGCSDEVRATILRVLEGIPGEIIPIEWSGFADARNAALDAARETGCDYALVGVDADDFLEPRVLRMSGGRVVLSPISRLDRDFYAFENVAELPYFRIAFSRLSAPARWRGKVHEQLPPDGVWAERLGEYRVRCTRDGRASQNDEAKSRHYYELSVAETTEDPTNQMAWYHLATAEVSLEDYPAALENYPAALRAFDRVLALEPGPDLAYACLCQSADLMRAIGHATESVVAVFDRAMAVCPERAEAPRWLANLLTERGEQPDRARELQHHADTLPFPTSSGWVDFSAYKEHSK